MDFTNSPTIWALGSIVRCPRRMRCPSRKRKASVSLIAVSDSCGTGRVARSLMRKLLLPAIVPPAGAGSCAHAPDRSALGIPGPGGEPAGYHEGDVGARVREPGFRRS